MAADLTVLHVVRAPYRRFAPLARPLLRIIVMLKKIGRLFIIKTRFEACLIIYALAMGAMARGTAYLHEYPGLGGKRLMAACRGSVFLAGAKIFDLLRHETAAREAGALSLPAPPPPTGVAPPA